MAQEMARFRRCAYWGFAGGFGGDVTDAGSGLGTGIASPSLAPPARSAPSAASARNPCNGSAIPRPRRDRPGSGPWRFRPGPAQDVLLLHEGLLQEGDGRQVDRAAVILSLHDLARPFRRHVHRRLDSWCVPGPAKRSPARSPLPGRHSGRSAGRPPPVLGSGRPGSERCSGCVHSSAGSTETMGRSFR